MGGFLLACGCGSVLVMPVFWIFGCVLGGLVASCLCLVACCLRWVLGWLLLWVCVLRFAVSDVLFVLVVLRGFYVVGG